MRNRLSIISSVLVFILTSCGSTQSISTSDNSNKSTSNDPSLNAVLWQQTAGEYDALCYQAYNAAKLYLERGSFTNYSSDDNREAAVIMDLDETVLDNSPYNARLIIDNKSYDEPSWDKWVKSEKATLVPGAHEFISFAVDNGFSIFYISNRKEENLESTINNLQKFNIDVQPDNIFLKTETSSKADRRQVILDKYNVVMYVGDNLADFDNMFEESVGVSERKKITSNFSNKFGSKFILLPNPMYGDWLRTLEYDDERGTSPSNNFQDKRRYLNPETK